MDPNPASESLLLATDAEVYRVHPHRGEMAPSKGLEGAHPTCLATDLHLPGRAWCGTTRAGVLRSDDGGGSWQPTSLAQCHITSLAASPSEPDRIWAGTEPSALWSSSDGGTSWRRSQGLEDLPSSEDWSFPPKPETHHVRWILCHPTDSGRLWLAIEAGALVSTPDGGRSWKDRVPGGPWDTHEATIHPDRPDTLRIAAGDGYFESHNAGANWASPADGLDIGYFRSVAVDPGDADVVLMSGATRPRSTYVAGHSDGRVYRRAGAGRWERVLVGWPDPPTTIAPLLRPGRKAGRLWAADERGVHRSDDGGRSWKPVAAFDPEGDPPGPEPPRNLRGMAFVR